MEKKQAISKSGEESYVSDIINNFINEPAKAKEVVGLLTEKLKETPEGIVAAYCHFGLYLVYSTGHGGVEEDKKAAYDHACAAVKNINKGDILEPDINIAMATCYFSGIGVEVNNEMAGKYYKLALDWKPSNPADEGKHVKDVINMYSLKMYEIFEIMLSPWIKEADENEDSCCDEDDPSTSSRQADGETRTISLCLSFPNGVSAVEAYPLTPAIQDYIDEYGLCNDIFQAGDEFGQKARFYSASSECGKIEIEDSDEEFDFDEICGTSLPLGDDDIWDMFQDDEHYDSMVEDACGDEDEAFCEYRELVYEKAVEYMDDDQRELYNNLCEDEQTRYVTTNFFEELKKINDEESEKYVFWLTNGESYKFEFNIALEDGEEFDVDKLKLVSLDDWCEDWEVFDAVNLSDYSIFPEWIMYDGRFIHCECAECIDFGCNESKVVLTDEEMSLIEE